VGLEEIALKTFNNQKIDLAIIAESRLKENQTSPTIVNLPANNA
jgi:hypothetical protein